MNDKQRVAIEAAKQVESGMLVGLGTGSTANYFIEELARRAQEDNLQLTTVSSSVVSAVKAAEVGLPLISIEQVSKLDLYVDGADEVTPDLTVLKGQGADLVREKLLAKACHQFIVLVDQSKRVHHIGERFPVPVEVLPFAWKMVQQSLEELGGRGCLRQNANQDGFAVSSHGSLILDVEFDADRHVDALNNVLNATPGIVEHGIFSGLASVVYVGVDGKVEEHLPS
ncbi:MAG TPA: ribose-5-phosphate isomerase RpiA [Crenotrichaceae bacterium]|nr:ribose-5-phosphate isomerase RpiA [Crenotrichaceae bacterium]